MIDTKELRIGNLVTIRDNHRPREIVAISGSWVDMRFPCGAKETYPDNKLVPIPLTPDLLLKCGLKPIGVTYRLDRFILWFMGIDSEYALMIWDERDAEYEANLFHVYSTEIAKVNSLHQLQNLYFALTGEELAISQ